MRRIAVVMALMGATALALVQLTPEPADGASHPPVQGARGIVAADNATASQVGAEILASGGNAADAAVAVASVLGMVHPFASGLGGGGFCLYYDASTQDVFAYDFRETAPAAAHQDMFLDADGNPQPQLSRRGGLAVGTPGEAAGLLALHTAHGRRPLGKVVEPAVSLGRHGYPVSPLLAKRLPGYRHELERRGGLTRWLRDDGELPVAGDTLLNPALADTWEDLGKNGVAALYEGTRAEAIVAAVVASGGVLDTADLAAYRVTPRAPIQGTYRGYQVYGMAPPSSGGVAVVDILHILEGFPLADFGHNSSASLHHLAESMKFAFADRAKFLGDADFVEVPVERLTSPAHAAERRAAILPEAVLPSAAYGDLHAGTDDSGTSHFSILDEDGNAAACTTTINTGFGSMVYVEAIGSMLNNEMDDFVQKPDTPNAFGLVGSSSNAVAAGKRPLSSMSPTLVLNGDGRVAFVVGGSGGPQIISSVVQVLVNVIDFGLSARAAVEAPRLHHQWLPDVLVVEPELPRDVVEALTARGHKTRGQPLYSAVQLVVAGEVNTAASDPRKMGQPAAQPE